jgi:hypothetical protein
MLLNGSKDDYFLGCHIGKGREIEGQTFSGCIFKIYPDIHIFLFSE